MEQLGEIAVGVRQGTLRLALRLRAERTSEALSLNKLSVLSDLHRGGPASAGALAASAHQRPQSLTRVFGELESDGLISRTQDESDRRQQVLTITTVGRVALATDMSQRDAWLARALAELTDVECEVLRLAGLLMDRIADATPTSITASGTQ
jgi:DNA-binding MarR family transcriptional regulator